MFNVGDKVIIHSDIYWMEGSPVRNLDGTIAEIVEVRQKYLSRTYRLKFLELKIKDPSKFDEDQCDMAWTDKHLELYVKDIDINNLESLLKE